MKDQGKLGLKTAEYSFTCFVSLTTWSAFLAAATCMAINGGFRCLLGHSVSLYDVIAFVISEN